MEKFKKVNIKMIDGSNIDASEALDVGQYYHILFGKHVQSIKKSDVKEISYGSKEHANDSSKYVK